MVIHHANTADPSRCFVRLYRLYNKLCPPDRPNGSFYLAPLKKYTESCWFSRSPLGHNSLKNFLDNICKEAGIAGFKTNHSLRATAATGLYASGIDEQLVIERTGHRSVEGIRSYKRTSSEQQENASDILNKRPCHDIVPYHPSAVSQPGTRHPKAHSMTSTTCNTLSLPSITNSSSDNSGAGSFKISSCSNFTINVNYHGSSSKAN